MTEISDAQRPLVDSPIVSAFAAEVSVMNEPETRTVPLLTVLIPARNEAENIPELLRQLGSALSGIPAEILFVDDSDDETPREIAGSARTCPVPVALVHRPAGERPGGLGGAVVAGLRAARGEWVLVMDADLQHPPETATIMARTAMRQDVDLVIGTRYAGANGGDGLNGPGRVLTSSLATRVSKAFFPRRLATISDPMSGLFVVRRSAIDVDRLQPNGFKILMEILVRHPAARVGEVAYQFAPRHAGHSKASAREGLTFARLLGHLRRDVLLAQLGKRPATAPERSRQAGRALSFGLVGASGIIVNTVVLWLVYHSLGQHELIAATVATQASTTWNFLLIDVLVYRQPKRGSRLSRGLRFYLMNNALLLCRLPVIVVLLSLGMGVLVANALTLAMLFLVRFLVSDRVIYGSASTVTSRDPVRMLVDLTIPAGVTQTSVKKRSNYLTYRYDIAGVVRIGSQIKLPELEFFRAQWIADDSVDIAVRVGEVGGRGPRFRAAMTEYSDPVTLRYTEHLGRLGANFRVMLGDPITIEVGPLLARSPHVVYTNIIEALLRFVLVSRGKMLLHSACVELDGVGVMLSALTDTGKTATILRLLREHGGRFLSDDMTIVDATGHALCFPKPLTISSHTLRAVQAEDLTPGEWRRLQFQSRLHSKGGRSLALTLARFNMPIMGINALVQMLIPPPKYTVDRLVPARLGSGTQVEELFIIERGAPRLADLGFDDTLRQMLINTDDAYGFPPFRYLAPAITINGQGYAQLREQEREILAGFLGSIRTRVLASDNFGWADEIPRLLAEERGVRQASGATRAASNPIADSWPRWTPSPAAAR
jgi:glycosyltransferase involved in cell wall biosynthesis